MRVIAVFVLLDDEYVHLRYQSFLIWSKETMDYGRQQPYSIDANKSSITCHNDMNILY